MHVGSIQTRLGEIILKLHDETPAHKASFMALANAHYWDSLSFNRVIPNFVAQAGCPDTPEGFTDTSMLLSPEINPQLKHIYGALGAGRDDNPQKNSARCQFYIVQNKNGLPRLDGNYTVFGQVIKGMDLIDSLVNLPRDKNDEPLEKVNITVRMRKIHPRHLK